MERENRFIEKSAVYLMTVFLVVSPFITYFKVEQPVGKELSYFAKKSRYIVDYFMYYKEAAVCLTAMILAIFLVLYALRKNERKLLRNERWIAGSVVLYLGSGVVSCLFSEYREITFWGLVDEYEGFAAIISYMILFVSGYVFLRDKKSRNILKTGICILALLLGICAVAGYVCGPVLSHQAIVQLLTPKRYHHLVTDYDNMFGDRVSLTFGNTGYFGGICALLLPAVLGMAYEEAGWKKYTSIAAAVFMMFSLYVAGSSGAFYASAVSVLMHLVMPGKRKKRFITLGSICGLSAALILGMGIWQKKDAVKTFEKIAVNESYQKSNGYKVKNISLKDGIVYINSDKNGFSVRVSDEDERILDIQDRGGNEIDRTLNGNTMILTQDGYQGVEITVESGLAEVDMGYKEPVQFAMSEDKKLYYVAFNGELMREIPQPVIKGMERYYSIFTGRGYTWISSLPLLKKCIFIGKGTGTFPFYFTQSEVAGMLNTHGSCNLFIEKAHNWYLQVAVCTGIFSLLCILVLFVLHAGGVRKYFYNTSAFSESEKGIFFGILAFQLVGMINDSTVAVNPVFWILLGELAVLC